MFLFFLLSTSFALLSERNVLGLKFSSDVITDLPSILSNGKLHLKNIELKAKTPHYGECWANAVSQLQVGCRSLNEDMQSNLALRLTDCFLQTSGHGPILCEVPRRECLQSLSDRAFNAYTEFYTHTQSMCYFLQSKLWHEETEKTIDKLAFTSLKVTSQLAEAERGQAALLQQQKESFHLQESLAFDLKTSRETINLLMGDIRAATEEQKSGLSALYEQVSALQSWVIGEVSWMDSILFYASSSLVTFLFTSTPRTRRARLLLFCLLAANYAIERSICSEKSKDVISPIFQVTENLTEWVWFSRKLVVFVSGVIVLVCYMTYKDYKILNHQLLLQIKKQNEEISVWMKKNDHHNYSNTHFPDILEFPSAIPLPYKTGSPLICSPTSNAENSKHHRESSPTFVKSIRKPFLIKDRNSVDLESQASSDFGTETSERSVRRSLRIKR